jgi:hypothetical protein
MLLCSNFDVVEKKMLMFFVAMVEFVCSLGCVMYDSKFVVDSVGVFGEEVLDSDFAKALKQEGVDRMLDAAYEAGLSARPVAAHSPGEAAHGAGLKTKAES